MEPARGRDFVWITLPAHLDAGAMLPRAIEHGVAYAAGAPFFVEEAKPNTLRLSFAISSDREIAEGIRRLSALVQATR